MYSTELSLYGLLHVLTDDILVLFKANIKILGLSVSCALSGVVKAIKWAVLLVVNAELIQMN